MRTPTRTRAAEPPVLNPSTVLATFRRADASQPTEVRVYVQPWNGRPLLHARWFTKAASTDSWHPTTKGVTFRPDDLAALEAAIVEARRILATEAGPAPTTGDA